MEKKRVVSLVLALALSTGLLSGCSSKTQTDISDETIAMGNVQNEEKVDIFLGNHMQHNHTEEKALKVKNGDVYAFVNPEEWKEYNLWCIKNMENMINRENEKHN